MLAVTVDREQRGRLSDATAFLLQEAELLTALAALEGRGQEEEFVEVFVFSEHVPDGLSTVAESLPAFSLLQEVSGVRAHSTLPCKRRIPARKLMRRCGTLWCMADLLGGVCCKDTEIS